MKIIQRHADTRLTDAVGQEDQHLKPNKSILISTKYAVFTIMILLFSTGCTYDNKETLYPNLAPCDTILVTYSKNISTIMTSYCISCHGVDAASLGSNIDLRTYDVVKSKIDRIYGCISHTNGYSPMPKGGSKIDECKIRQVKKWKDTGAQNN